LFPEIQDMEALVGTGGWAAGMKILGHSREGRPVLGRTLGRGPLQAILVAGAHAEEPAGPALLRWLLAVCNQPDHPCYEQLILGPLAGPWAGKHLLDAFTLHVIPHLHPDGEMRAVKAGWLDPAPEADGFFCASPVDFAQLSHRDLPGSDLEFGWPWSSEELEAASDAHTVPHIPPTTMALPNETAAAAHYLYECLARNRDMQRPLVFHGTLHGMAFGSGAWCLLGRSWTRLQARSRSEAFPASGQVVAKCAVPDRPKDASAPLRIQIMSCAFRRNLPLHDVDKDGAKGFFRLGPGFSTAPDIWSMRHHFLDHSPPQPDVASSFRPSSMDFARGLGVDPLVLVSEIPLFLLDAPEALERLKVQMDAFKKAGLEGVESLAAPEPGQSRQEKLRNHLQEVRPRVDRTSGFPSEWAKDYQIRPLAAGLQMALIGDYVMAGLACSAAQSGIQPK
jgi:hypothetical protein